MYQVGQLVAYGMHGVCGIVDLETKRIDGKNIRYFVLEPLDQRGSRYYLPADSTTALSKVRDLYSKEALTQLLATPLVHPGWIADEGKRKIFYRELIVAMDLKAIIHVIRCLWLHRNTQKLQGKKFHLCDENFLRDAQRILSSEMIAVFQISAEQARQYLQELEQAQINDRIVL